MNDYLDSRKKITPKEAVKYKGIIERYKKGKERDQICLPGWFNPMDIKVSRRNTNSTPLLIKAKDCKTRYTFSPTPELSNKHKLDVDNKKMSLQSSKLIPFQVNILDFKPKRHPTKFNWVQEDHQVVEVINKFKHKYVEKVRKSVAKSRNL